MDKADTTSSSLVDDFKKIHYADIPNFETIAYRDIGSGSHVLVLIHGTGQGAQWWQLVAPRFAAKYRVIAVDLRGSGHSSNNFPVNSHDENAEDVKQLLDVLKIHRCTVAGWTSGAEVMYALAIKHHHLVEKMIYYWGAAPQGRNHRLWQIGGYVSKKEDVITQCLSELAINKHPGVIDFARAMAKRDADTLNKILTIMCTSYTELSGRPFWDEMIQEMLNMRNVVDAAFAWNNFDATNYLNADKTVKVVKDIPTLILQGDDDPCYPKETHGLAWQALIGDMAEYHLIKGGHWPSKETFEPHLEIIFKFLEAKKAKHAEVEVKA